ncbi:MAG: hypothetical protein ACUVV4_04450 [Candidatus Bathyarchaeia archaeon]
MAKKSLLTGIMLIVLSLSIVGVTAYVFERATQTIAQNIVEIASITLKNSDLGEINEGQTRSYTNETVPNLGDAVSITTTVSGVKLHFDSDLDDLSSYYSTYDIDVKLVAKPEKSSLAIGEIVCTLSLSEPDYSSVNLDVEGTYRFNFEITTTASSVSSDTPTTVTIIVSAEST